MMENIIDELVDYIENCTYIDVLQELTYSQKIKQKYDSAWPDKVDKVVRNAIANNHDALYASVLNDCCDVFELDDKERKELMGRMLNERN